MPEDRTGAPAPSAALLAGLAVVVVVIIVVGVVWLVPLLNRPTSGNSPPNVPLTTPIGAALAIAAPREASNGPHTWYNFSILSAGSDLQFDNLSLQVQTVTGSVVPPTAQWTVGVLGPSGTQIAAYAMVSDTWTQGSTLSVSSGPTIVLDAATSQLSGTDLVVHGSGAFSGTISVTIP